LRARIRRRRAGIAGTVRADRRTKNLLHRIEEGEIALLDHADLDQPSAEGLVDRGVAAVLNVADALSGSYPNAGPLVLERAGVLLIDQLGADAFTALRDGERITVHPDGVVERDGLEIARGRVLAGEELDTAMRRATRNLGVVLESFVRNTVEYLERERELILQGEGVPEIRTPIRGRGCVVVVRGNEHRADLVTLRTYIREQRPVLIAVDGAADALLEVGYKPDLIVGDMDSISSQALTSGAELVVHAYPDGRAPGLERVRALGLDAALFPSLGTSEDIALLLAYEHGADLIVSVGGHDNLVEFLDKGRSGMSSTFIVRLKVGPKLVDAKGVNRLYHSSVRTRDLVLLTVAAAGAMGVAAMIIPGPRLFIRQSWDLLIELFRGITG
jgi:uncharacterized membrane-anchored protein